uniref:Zinc transporter ZupT n=1 Tax=Amphora coffeiformis TaxID=265554 RepID=A0A7S3LH35_9STRA
MGRADNENVGIAFALVIGAGAATGLGAAVVFVPALVKLASRKTLASALGLSAGVMTYVSFVEIFAKSSGAFEDAGHDEDKAYILATLCFFAGVILMVLLNKTVTWLLGGHHHHHHDHHEIHGHTETGRMSSVSNNHNESGKKNLRSDDENSPNQTEPQVPRTPQEENDCDNCSTHSRVEPVVACCSEDPAGDLQHLQDMASEIDNYEHTHNHHWEGAQRNEIASNGSDSEDEGRNADPQAAAEEVETKKLMRMSLNTALAIGLHNFPEGLATFVAALADPSVGAVLAIAIAIHNVPEGLCVAMPIYYATGNRMQAFGWAMVSGIAEPIAALLGWAVLANSFSDQSYAVLFGVVAGMMVIISARELLPTAHRYDPEDSVVTYSFMAGMAIMAVSLVLFLL